MVGPARRAIERLYTGRATVYRLQAEERSNYTTGFEKLVSVSEAPCRLSYSRVQATADTDTAAGLIREIKLFLAPETEVPPGSRIEVTQNGETVAYQSSGPPARYSSHQEIPLVLFEKWG